MKWRHTENMSGWLTMLTTVVLLFYFLSFRQKEKHYIWKTESMPHHRPTSRSRNTYTTASLRRDCVVLYLVRAAYRHKHATQNFFFLLLAVEFIFSSVCAFLCPLASSIILFLGRQLLDHIDMIYVCDRKRLLYAS